MYTYRYTVTTRMTCVKMGSDESRFKASLIVRDKVTRQCPQTATFEEKGEPKRYRTYEPTALPLGQTGSQRTRQAQRTGFNTLDNWAIKFPPKQKRERKERLKGHGPEHTQARQLKQQCTSRWAMARGHCLNTSVVLAAVHGFSGLFLTVSAVEPSLFRPLHPPSPSLISHLASVDVKQNVQHTQYTRLHFVLFFVFLQAHHCGAFIQKHSSIVTVLFSLTLSHVFVGFFLLTCTSRTMPLPLGYSVHNFRFQAFHN